MNNCVKCDGSGTTHVETQWRPVPFTCAKCGGTGKQPALFYAGVGSRSTPLPIVAEMENIAMRLALSGWVLRTGAGKRKVPPVPDTDSADLAFERGAASMNGKMIIRVKTGYQPALDHAARFHPAWDKCDEHARCLHARNSQVVVGDDFETPARFLLCWTPRGAIVGGTGQALRVADAYDIPTFNLASVTSADFWNWFEGRNWQ